MKYHDRYSELLEYNEPIPKPRQEEPKGLTVAFVRDWKWTTSEDHYGKIPELTKLERTTWSELYDKKATTRLSKSEFALFTSLDRKVRYRAKKAKFSV